MLSAYSTALSGLNAMSDAIDIVGNNLSNLNTTGYKETRASFKDLVAQSSGSADQEVGLGTLAPLNSRIFSQGTINTTAGKFDAAINGDGFFVVKDKTGEDLFTRDGSFTQDSNGYLVTATGEFVQGWTINSQGVLTPNGPLGNIQIPVGQSLAPQATSSFSLSGNLDATATPGSSAATFSYTVQMVDSLGNFIPVDVSLSKATTPTSANAASQWNYSITTPNLPTGAITIADPNATVSSNPPNFAIAQGKNDTLNLLVDNGQAQSITLSPSDASLKDVVKDLNNGKLLGATASIGVNNSLVITSNTAGTGTVQIQAGNANTTLGIPATGAAVTTAGTAYTGSTVPGLSLNSTNNVVNLSVDGGPVQSLTLNPADASLQDIASDLNTQFSTKNIGASASVDPVHGLVIKSTNSGPSASIDVLPTGTVNSTIGLTTTFPVQFDSSGNMIRPSSSQAPVQVSIQGTSPGGFLSDGAQPINFKWSLFNNDGTPTFTQFSESSAISSAMQNGRQAAQLIGVSLADGGKIVASYSNGAPQQVVGQLAVASVGNPDSLLDVGNNNFTLSAQTAAPAIGTAGTGGRGTIQGSALESSTVDIASQFSSLLIYQRSYQANSRVVTVADQLSQDAVNLIHE